VNWYVALSWEPSITIWAEGHPPILLGLHEITSNANLPHQLGQMRIEKQNIPSRARNAINVRFRNFESDIDASKRKLKTLSDDRSALFGDRYSDLAPSDAVLNQRQQLLSGTERLQRSSGRLMESQRIANETEAVGASTLANLQGQRETILHTRGTLLQSETQVERSVKTLRGMARRY
jgi:vesicle transport through interaction with t-SNAREs 1